MARHRSGVQVKGPWPAPAVEAIEAAAAKYAADWPAWGHRKIAALLQADGYDVSTATVRRALARRGLLLPRGFRADRKSWAVLRRRVFLDPPTERNRVWQIDFSEFETSRGGIWHIGAVVDYATKYALAVTITPAARGPDALACLHAAIAEACRLLQLDDLRDDRGVMDLFGPDDAVLGQVPAPIAVVSDNGPCFKSHAFAAAFTGEDPLLRHVRTRVKSPQTNGVVERFFGTLKYEHLYRAEIADLDALAMETARFRTIYNTIRPHQALANRTPDTPTSTKIKTCHNLDPTQVTGSGYPDFATSDPWSALIDAGRCRSVCDGRRCQPWRDHATRRVLRTDLHAHEWRENLPAQPMTHAPTRLPTVRWVRWDDAGNVTEVEPGSERLPWAAMGRP